MKVYVAQFCSAATYEAEMDDPSMDWDSMASPQLASISLTLSDEWVAKVKADAEEDFHSVYDEIDENEKRPVLVWTLHEHRPVQENGRVEFWEHWAKDEDDELQIVLVVQERETE